MSLLSFENLGIEGDNEVDDDELAQINELFVPGRIVTLAAEKKSLEQNTTQKITMILMTMVSHTMKKDQKHSEAFFEREIEDQKKHISWLQNAYFFCKLKAQRNILC